MFIKAERVERNGTLPPLPKAATVGSSGLDLAYADRDEVVIEPGKWAVLPTGIKIALEFGCEAQIRSRSGLAAKHGIMVLNSPGTIDSDYRGEIKVILMNFGTSLFVVRQGDRIAQLVVSRVERVRLVEGESLDGTLRGDGGFGSTGVRAFHVA